MDNTRIYEYAFSCMFDNVKKARDRFVDAHNASLAMQRHIILLSDDNGDLYTAISRSSKHSIILETQNLIMRLFAKYGISYVPFTGDEQYSYIPFTRREENKLIAYIFSTSLTKRINNWAELRDKYNLDGIKVVALAEIQDDIETLNSIRNFETQITGGFVTYEPIECLFKLLGDKEYSTYKEYCKKFNDSVRKLIGYSTIKIPSEEMLASFKRGLIEEIVNFEYEEYLFGINKSSIKILNENFFNRELYRVIFGKSNFADSFISSEWYYSMLLSTSGIEQTAIIAGHLKSIEQLLFKIIMFSAGSGKTIKRKYSFREAEKQENKKKYIELETDNLEKVDTTLGSLIGFISYEGHKDLWCVNEDCRKYVIDKLHEYRDKCRNDHFHKDNIYTSEEIDVIRNETIVLYYLLLGSLKISAEEALGLDMYRDKEETKDLLTYQKLDDWLSGILGGDNLLKNDIPIYFWLRYHGKDTWHLDFCTITDFDENLCPVNMEYPYISNALEWDVTLSEQESEEEICRLISQYLNNGEYSEELKKHEFIAVGQYRRPVILYENTL